MSYLTMRLGPDRLWGLRNSDFKQKGLCQHPPRSPDMNVMDISYWVQAEKWIWGKSQDEVPKSLEELKEKLELFSDLCCQTDSQQHKDMYSTFYGVPDPAFGNERRGGLAGRFFLDHFSF